MSPTHTKFSISETQIYLQYFLKYTHAFPFLSQRKYYSLDSLTIQKCENDHLLLFRPVCWGFVLFGLSCFVVIDGELIAKNVWTCTEPPQTLPQLDPELWLDQPM